MIHRRVQRLAKVKSNVSKKLQEVKFYKQGRTVDVRALLRKSMQYPIILTENGIMKEEDGKSILAGTLPEGIEISKAAKDLLHKLLQCNPRTRLKSAQAMQRTAFYFGVDIQSYMLKENSPFRLLGRKNGEPLLPKTDYSNIFRSFSSITNNIDTNIN